MLKVSLCFQPLLENAPSANRTYSKIMHWLLKEISH